MKRTSRNGDIASITGEIKIEKMSMRKSSREEIVHGTGIGSVTAAIGTRLVIGTLMKTKTSTGLPSTGLLSLGHSSIMGAAIIGHIGTGEIGRGRGRGIDLARGIRRLCMSDVVRCV